MLFLVSDTSPTLVTNLTIRLAATPDKSAALMMVTFLA